MIIWQTSFYYRSLSVEDVGKENTGFGHILKITYHTDQEIYMYGLSDTAVLEFLAALTLMKAKLDREEAEKLHGR